MSKDDPIHTWRETLTDTVFEYRTWHEPERGRYICAAYVVRGDESMGMIPLAAAFGMETGQAEMLCKQKTLEWDYMMWDSGMRD